MWWLEHAKDLSETIALISGAAYFGYKAYTGYLRVNLSLSLQCVRQTMSATHDILVVCARLTKGPNGSLTLHDIQARVRHGGTSESITLGGIDRSECRDEMKPFHRKAVDWGRVDPKSPHLKLVPGEATELAAYCEVRTDSVCLIEVAVLGQQTNRHPFGQWKASCVSLPTSTRQRGAASVPGC